MEVFLGSLPLHPRSNGHGHAVKDHNIFFNIVFGKCCKCEGGRKIWTTSDFVLYCMWPACGSTHQNSDSVHNDLVPVMYDGVCVILYQILSAVTCLQLLSEMDSITGFNITNMDCICLQENL